jgi:hypothetical protein
MGALRQVAPGRVAQGPATRSQTMAATRPRSGGGLGALFKALLGLLVVAAVGGVGYRYWRHGYILTPSKPQRASIQFRTIPADTEIRVDGEPLATRPFQAVPERAYTVTFHASGRLTVRRNVTPAAGQTISLHVRLPLAATAIDPATSRFPPPTADRVQQGAVQPFDVIDQARDKVELYAHCMALGVSLTDSEQAYMKSTTGRIGPNSLPIVLPLDVDAVLECRALAETARARNPQLSELDAEGTRYAEALGELAPMLRDLAAYYHGDGHTRDKLERGRKAHAELVQLYRRAHAAQGQLAQQIHRQRQVWQAAELAAIGEHDGKGAYWHMRQLLLASQEWVLAELGNAARSTRESRRGELDAAYQQAREFGKDDGLHGAAEYLTSVAAVIERTYADALAWHNNSVALFNKMILVE